MTDRGGLDAYYWVNQRFMPAFRVVYASDENSGVAKFADRFFIGSGKIYRDELISATQDLLQKDYNSQLIKKMEKNMVKYFDVAKQRLDAEKRKAWE